MLLITGVLSFYSSISSRRILTILQPQQFEALSAEYEEYIVAFIAEQKSLGMTKWTDVWMNGSMNGLMV